ncbi:Inner centromere protein-related protein pic1 [Escovopsis weberi]|uniref:Inner centromere protein-related protein pic1 n=1 Tax=Escovopsis weberi TaxID=150374 RepID=A0A0M9VT02_ESCWE|nr:Inner centromere protein-related protein pic1 [Escovopsis weberi]
MSANSLLSGDSQALVQPTASTEREKEEKRREREARFMADQNDKLDRAREEEREKARVFGKEQEQVAAMEKKVASKNQQERFAARVSPEKAKAKDEAELRHAEVDVEMTDGGSGPATKIGGLGQLNQTKEGKRPVRPTKEAIPKAKQAPTVIRVNTSSQTTQYGSRASTASHDTGGMSSSQASSRGSKITLQSKSSSQNLKALPTAVRPKALDMSVKKREQEEREVQRRREAKAEIERKRAAIQEEQRRHAEKQRQVAAEKAKQTRAPTSAMRSHTNIHTNIPSEGGFGQQRGEPSRPPSRMTSGMPVSTTFSSAVKTGAKRALAHDAGDEGQAKRPVSRGGPSYQAKDGKRRRTSEVVNDPEVGPVRNIKGPPVRPSNGFKKDMAPKTVFQSGYTNAPPPHSATRDLFKATVTAQHNSQVKGSHPLDLAQISKGPIPFAANTGAPGSSYKTPARIGSFAAGKSTAKKATRSSPRFQSGETIELPEIQTDDEDEDDDAQAMMVAAWADSPDLRRALIRQETLDPSQIFGPPAPLDMEEVFNKSKDKWHKFRQRTSSANWNGLDRLTEEDIRKDMAAREKLRRDGGWSYEMSKNL